MSAFSVSVVIPCRNAERWIEDTLRSVAAQRQAALEVIVIDDASTDRTVERVRATGVPVTLLAGPGGNAAVARNLGIAAARGDWIAFLDADDLWDRDHLARARDLLAGGRDVAYMANHRWMEATGRVIPMPPSLAHRLETGTGLTPVLFVEALAAGFHFGHSTVLVRRDRSREVGMFDPTQRKRHDIDHWLRVVEGRTWAYCAQPTASYRITPGGISRDIVGCELYYLRALLKNAGPYRGSAAMTGLIRTSAQRAMSLSFVDGTEEQFRDARALSWAHLAPGYRAFYRASRLCPGAFRAAIRTKRRVLGLPATVNT